MEEKKFCIERFKEEKIAYTREGKAVKFGKMRDDVIIVEVPHLYSNTPGYTNCAYSHDGRYLERLADYLTQKYNKPVEHYLESPNQMKEWDITNDKPDVQTLFLHDLSFTPKIRCNKNTTAIYNALQMIEDWDNYDFDVTLSNGKNLQRGLVWSENQKSQFILSILRGNPLSPIVVVRRSDYLKNGREVNTQLKVIDGKQRLHALKSFMEGEFSIENNGLFYKFSQLSFCAKRAITNLHIIGDVYYEFTDEGHPGQNELFTDQEYVKLFESINFIGTQQDQEHLTELKKSLI